MLRILYDDFDQKVKNTHDGMDLHHSYKKKLYFGKTLGCCQIYILKAQYFAYIVTTVTTIVITVICFFFFKTAEYN